jgi:hypothetical protein
MSMNAFPAVRVTNDTGWPGRCLPGIRAQTRAAQVAGLPPERCSCAPGKPPCLIGRLATEGQGSGLRSRATNGTGVAGRAMSGGLRLRCDERGLKSYSSPRRFHEPVALVTA